jgi:hypothetical protein
MKGPLALPSGKQIIAAFAAVAAIGAVVGGLVVSYLKDDKNPVTPTNTPSQGPMQSPR